MRKVSLPSILRYKKSYLRHDIITALLIAVVNVPNALAFSVIVGLPPETGLYTTIIGALVFGLLGYSHRLVVGADSATAILLASGAVLVAQTGTPEYVNVIAAMTLLSGVLLLLLGLFKFGFLADLVSRPVMIGFMAGVAPFPWSRARGPLPQRAGKRASGYTA